MPIASYAKVTLDVCDDRGTPYEVDFEDIELINEKESADKTDWSSFRREAAKDILCAVLAGGIANGAKGFDARKEELVNASIGVADELIKQLREEKK